MPFFIIFLIVPVLEIVVFSDVAGKIGLLQAVLLIILSGVVGGALIRQQGLLTLLAMQRAMSRGEIPLQEVFDGFCRVGAGVLLIFPGFLTDVLAILLLLPTMRRGLHHFIKNRPGWHEARGTSADSFVIEGEFERVEEDREKLN